MVDVAKFQEARHLVEHMNHTDLYVALRDIIDVAEKMHIEGFEQFKDGGQCTYGKGVVNTLRANAIVEAIKYRAGETK